MKVYHYRSTWEKSLIKKIAMQEKKNKNKKTYLVFFVIRLSEIIA